MKRLYSLFAFFALIFFVSKGTTAQVTPVSITTMASPVAAGITSPLSQIVNKGDSVSVTAKRNFGYKFKQWQDSLGNFVSKDSVYKMVLNTDLKLIAVFDSIPTYSFSVAINGSNSGEVLLSPSPVSGKYEAGTLVSVSVVPNPVTSFSYWEDNSTVLQRSFTVNTNIAIAATFDEIPFIVGWNFKAQTPRSARTGDYYSDASNKGFINLYQMVNGAAATSVNWLANVGSFSPSYPNIRFWSLGANFKTTRRHLKANFATTGYKNIQVKSMVAGNYQAYSVVKLQYSLNDTTYTDLAQVDLTQTFGSTWKDLNVSLPAAAENKPTVYLKWIGDTTSAIINPGTGNDGTAITNIYVYADKFTTADTSSPVFISAVPAANSAIAPTTGSIVVTFNERVIKANASNITLDTTVLVGTYGTTTANFKYQKLKYDQEYTFTIPDGALTDLFGNPFHGLSFKFRTAKRPQPAMKLFDAVVAKDGSGNYTSVIDAINAAPSGRTTPWLIYIKNGKYLGHHDIPATKPFIHLIGQSRDSVVISDNRLSGGPTAVNVNLGATMVVNSTDVYFENLTLENNFGYDSLKGPQALALYALTNHFTTNNVWLRSYQDTYLSAYNSISDRQYHHKSKIEGAVDFIYGGGDVFFDTCNITVNRPDGGYIVAPSHGKGTAWGYVFRNCIIDESPRIHNGSNYFGRPWNNAPKTVFINTTLKTGIKPAGWWYTFGTIPAIFADYNTMDSLGNPVDLSQRISAYQYNSTDSAGKPIVVKGTAKNSLTDAEAASYTYENVTLRSTDTWDPRFMVIAPTAPSNLKLSTSTLSWDSVQYARLYIVFRNDSVVGFSTATSFTDSSAVAGLGYIYKVQAVGEYGTLSLKSTASSALPVIGLELSAERKNGVVSLNWIIRKEINTSHYLVEKSSNGIDFTAIGQVNATSGRSIGTYSFIDNNASADAAYYRIKVFDVDNSYSISYIVSVKAVNGNKISIYPAVASSSINITYPKSSTKDNIDIYNVNGKKLIHFVVNQGSAKSAIDISRLVTGIYILAYTNEAKTYSFKFIKQ